MDQPKKSKRRQFLKNTSLAALSLGLFPNSGKTEEIAPNKSALVDCNKTTLDYYGPGPFYTKNPPILHNGLLAKIDEPGTRLILSGRVFNLDCKQCLPNTKIDIWHANQQGRYDNSGYNLRGITTTNSQGFYFFETVKPGKYLNGSSYRPSHIHFKITPPGFPTLTTQLYFEGDSDIPDDTAASITSGDFDARDRIIPISKNKEGKYEGTWDIVINGEGMPTSTTDIHLEKGIIYKVFPKPGSKEMLIDYGVFDESQATLSVFDLQGQLVAKLEERKLSPNKYQASWLPDAALPNGTYFVALKINDLQIHYLKTNLLR